jgi:hypothetical protein
MYKLIRSARNSKEAQMAATHGMESGIIEDVCILLIGR